MNQDDEPVSSSLPIGMVPLKPVDLFAGLVKIGLRVPGMADHLDFETGA
jgi:hypothetical protein